MKFVSLIVIVVSLMLPSGYSMPEQADVVFINGNIYTVNDGQPRAEAIAVKGGRIIFVGSTARVKAYQGKTTRVIDLHGNTVVPGLTDSHYHLSGVGAREIN